MTGERNVMAFCLLMINMSITTVVTMYIETFVTMAATQKNKFVAFFSVAFLLVVFGVMLAVKTLGFHFFQELNST